MTLPTDMDAVRTDQERKGNDFYTELDKKFTELDNRVNNLEASEGSGGASPVTMYLSGAVTTNDATEITFYTHTVSSLGTNGVIYLELRIQAVNTAGGSRNNTYRIKLGATTIFTLNRNIGSSTDLNQILIRCWVSNDGSTSSQSSTLDFKFLSIPSSETTGAVWTTSSGYVNTSTEDTTSPLDLVITGQMPNTTATQTMQPMGLLVALKAT